jgi:ParB family transcriptional regulator, chromosome partitioning protein
MSKRKALGRGLGALIPGSVLEDPGAIEDANVVPIERVHANPDQPRKHFDEDHLEELARSIGEHGIIQPLLVSPDRQGYRIIAGERRWRAAALAGLKEVPVVVREVTERESFAIALVENLQRVDLNPIEEAEGYRRLADEFAMTQDDIARSVGKDRSTVANLLRLLKLSEPVLMLVREGALSMGHARVLVTIADPKRQLALANQAIDNELSVRQMEALGREDQERPAVAKTPVVRHQDPNVRALLDKLTRQYGTKVHFGGDMNKGKIVLEYFSPEEFDRLIEQLLS